MAAKRKQITRANARQDVYVDGNTVRKLNRQAEPVRPERREPKKEQRRSHVVRRNQEKALHMDGAYVFALTVAAVITLFICMNYLRVQSSITTRINRIEELELELENMKSENDALQTRIDTYVDLDHIFKVATEELGMVYANRNQILLYNKTESEYVRQYEDIPKHE